MWNFLINSHSVFMLNYHLILVAKYKKDYEFLREVDSLELTNAQMNLDKAYKNFFRDKSVEISKR